MEAACFQTRYFCLIADDDEVFSGCEQIEVTRREAGDWAHLVFFAHRMWIKI